MSDPFENLRHIFDEGSPVNRLPAPEVRRRGDRMRRRQTMLSAAGAAAAVAVIASGGLFVSQGVNGTAPDPGPATNGPSSVQPSYNQASAAASAAAEEATRSDWVTTISEDFPLALGLPEEGGANPPRTTATDLEGWHQFACEAKASTEADGQRVDGRGIVADTPAERHARELALYEDAETARSAVEQRIDLAASCGEVQLLGIPNGIQRFSATQVTDAAHPYILVEERADSGDARVP